MQEINYFRQTEVLACVKSLMGPSACARAVQEYTQLLGNAATGSGLGNIATKIDKNIEIIDNGNDEEKEQFKQSANFYDRWSKTLKTLEQYASNSMSNVVDRSKQEDNNLFDHSTLEMMPKVDDFKFSVHKFIAHLQ